MKKKLKSNLFIGVLSGTSADSIDAGLFKIDKKISFLNFASTKYNKKLKDAILDISRNKKLPSQKILEDIDNKVGEISEDEGHHPDISFGWGYAEIKITTHAIEGLSENDFILAAKIDQLTNA